MKTRKAEAGEDLSSLIEEQDEEEGTIEDHLDPYTNARLNMVPEATNEVDTPTMIQRRSA